MFQKIWGVIFFLAFSPAAWAFEADGIYYDITSSSDKTVAVASGNYSDDVTIPATVTNEGIEYRVTAIGNYAFQYCENLTSVTIPESVTAIGKEAFYFCTGLTEFKGKFATDDHCSLIVNDTLFIAFAPKCEVTEYVIPNGVKTIGDEAFYNCTGLASVTIPESVTAIGNGAFRGCMSLEKFEGKFASTDNRCLVVRDTLVAFAPSGLSEYIIPDGVTTIGVWAFYDCQELTSVTIPESVTSIGNYAFMYCWDLTSITIPESVTSIGSSAFASCTGLSSVTIGNSVTSIGDGAFYGCTGLTEFKGKFATDDHCSLIVNDTLFIAFAPKCEVTEYVIPNGVRTIGDWAFDGCTGLTSVTIPDGVTFIGRNAFSSCKSLTSVTIGESVTTIGNRAFASCKSLTSVTIPDGVTFIGGHAFSFCTGLTSVTIPDGVTYIGECAFYDCDGLTSVTAYNPTPVDIRYAFLYVNCENCTLYVPAESVELYKAAEGWKEFGEILPIDESSAITEIRQNKADGHVTVYNLQGVLVLETNDATDLKTLQNGAYIVNGKKMIIAR